MLLNAKINFRGQFYTNEFYDTKGRNTFDNIDACFSAANIMYPKTAFCVYGYDTTERSCISKSTYDYEQNHERSTFNTFSRPDNIGVAGNNR